MGKKKMITQANLDKMSPKEVLALDEACIPEGFDVQHEDGKNAKLVKTTDETETTQKSDEPINRDNRTLEENSGKLFLRFFKKDDTNGKILTRYKRKVYFPQDSTIEPGWYVAAIVEERENHGIMDTMNLDAIDPILWTPKCIKGIYVKRNHANNTLEIYPAIPKDQLDQQQSTLIYTVKLAESTNRSSGASIAEILAAKKSEVVKDNV